MVLLQPDGKHNNTSVKSSVIDLREDSLIIIMLPIEAHLII